MARTGQLSDTPCVLLIKWLRGWSEVPDDTGGYRGQLAVLVKPNGLFGRVYMAAIKPFRYLFVYPALVRTIERDWQERSAVT
ncbi:MAG: DUF2867 domain-containing protein [Streptosporangiales bacterium]|nr:DUF2867 domain-containing protein [Streptosporangiales bacterium]